MAFGVLSGLFLSNRPSDLIAEVYSFCEAVGLPVTLEQLGIINPSKEDLFTVAEAACAPSEFIWHEPVEITVGKVVESIRKADDYGKVLSRK